MTIELAVTKEEIELVLFALKALENESIVGLNDVRHGPHKADADAYIMRKLLSKRIDRIGSLGYYLRAKADI